MIFVLDCIGNRSARGEHFMLCPNKKSFFFFHVKGWLATQKIELICVTIFGDDTNGFTYADVRVSDVKEVTDQPKKYIMMHEISYLKLRSTEFM